jgi:hypothetical protein
MRKAEGIVELFQGFSNPKMECSAKADVKGFYSTVPRYPGAKQASETAAEIDFIGFARYDGRMAAWPRIRRKTA